MLTLTSSAAEVVSNIREKNGVPDEFGLRVFPQQGTEGSEVKLAFAPEPAAGDAVTESEGQRLFVAPELAEPLGDAVLDARSTPEGTGFYLRQPSANG